mgnify:CR=1 FL=1
MQRRLTLAAGTAAATLAAAGTYSACRDLERQRRPIPASSPTTMSSALPNLQASGVSVADKVIDQGLICAVKATTAFQSMPAQLPKPTRAERQRQQEERFRARRGDVPLREEIWRASAPGRLHRREETFGESDLKVLEQVELRFWPMVLDFFRDGDEAGDEDGALGIYRSELQVMTALPGSAAQTWHSDNSSRGLTIIVPLVDFTAANGATQVLVGSHSKDYALVAQQGAQVVQAPVGAIVAYDSRAFHRGLGNLTDEARPALIFCYDRTASPPPGRGSMGMIGIAWLASTLNVASAGWISTISALRR